jgi:hypothetical protein
MRLATHHGIRTLGHGLVALGLTALCATRAPAQVVFDGNILFNNNASGTLAGQFVGAAGAGAPACAPGTTAAQLGTVVYTHNLYADPLLPNATYRANVVPDWKPAPGSPAYLHSVTVPNNGFFVQTCYAGAIAPDEPDWTLGWTYYDSTGANRQDLHLSGMPNPRPLAVYDNISLYSPQTWGADSNYLVRGQLRVKDQSSLTIRPGTVIFEERATTGTMIIERGAKIFSIGTATAPIIITCDDPPGTMERGGGGSLVLNGRATINNANSCLGDSAASEGGAIGYYGGNDDNDGSGELRYTRIEYSGKQITPNNELNSFTFNGCGRNTIIEYCQAHRGADDAFEWFGGSMNSKHLIGTDGTDDGFDWQQGWHGFAQFCVFRTSADWAPVASSARQFGDKGIEADNSDITGQYDNTTCSGRAWGQVANFTFIGDPRNTEVGVNEYPGCTSAVNLRRGTRGTVINSIAYNYKTAALKVDDDQTWQAHCSAPPAAPLAYCGFASGVEVTNGRVFVANGAPNPFRSHVAIHFTLPQSGRVRVEIYAADGRRVDTLLDDELAAGSHSVTWSVGKSAPSGVYFYRVLAGGAESTGRITRVD